MPIARVEMPDGRIARFEVPEGMSPEEIEVIALQHSGVEQQNTERERHYTVSAGPFGKFRVGGVLADAAIALNNVDDKDSVPLALGLAGSVAFPPAAAVRGAPLVRGLLQRFGPSIGAAGAGGGTGAGLVESGDPDATAGSIAGAALRGGAEMALAETAGLGIGGVANRAIAPNLRFLDPGKPVREAARKAVTEVRSIAERVGKALRKKVGDDPAAFLARVAGDGRLVSKLNQVLSAKQFQTFVRFARSDLGHEAAEALAVPTATMLGGPFAGAAVLAGKALLAPGPLQRYLARSGLPNEATRTLGRQTLTTGIRGGLLAEEPQ